MPEAGPNGQPSVPLEGHSLPPLLEGQADASPYGTQAVGFDDGVARHLYAGKWKIVQNKGEPNWRLYDIENDRNELNDLASTNSASSSPC